MQLDRLVEDVLRITELQSLRSRLVGTPGSYGLDGTHFAHFVVAAELMLNPSVLLCGALSLDSCGHLGTGACRAQRASAHSVAG